MNTSAETQPRNFNPCQQSIFLGHVDQYDVYAKAGDNGANTLVLFRHRHPTKGSRTLSFVWAHIFAGRGNRLWRAALRLADSHGLKHIAAALDNPDDMVVVRTHLRRRPRR